MNYPYNLLFKQLLWRLAAPFVVPFMLRKAVKTDVITSHHAQPNIQRYRLPKKWEWVETPDEHLPGGMYEPTVAKLYKRFGWFITSWYWLGLRNVGQGLLFPHGAIVHPVYTSITVYQNEEDVTYWRRRALLNAGLKQYPPKSFLFFWEWYAYYELVKDFYGVKSGRPDPDWRTVTHVAVLRLGIRRKRTHLTWTMTNQHYPVNAHSC